MKKLNLLSGFLIALVIFLSLLLYLNMQSKEKITNELASLQVDESIDEMALISEDGTTVNRFKMSTYETAAIFIFSRPCSPCNKNIPFWRRLSSLKKADIFGIIVDEPTKMVNFSESMNLNFKLYAPFDINIFKEIFRLKFDLAQTLLLKHGKIIYVKVGELTPQDYFEIAKKLDNGGI